MKNHVPVMQQLNDNDNLNKYKSAGLIATKAVNKMITLAKPNTKLLDVYNQGINFVKLELDKVYKEIQNKGFSFPICLSINNIAGHYVPNNKDVLNDGDILKIELGVHIDGYPSFIVYSTVVGSDKNNEKKANVMKAVIEASKEILTKMTPGTLNTEIVKIMEKYASKYSCNLPLSNEYGIIPGVFSYQISNSVCDGYNTDDYAEDNMHRFILNRHNSSYGYSLTELELEENEIYAIDVLMSSGTGKLNLIENLHTSVYRRNYENFESLKLKTSRDTLSSFGKNCFPVHMNMSDPKTRLGLKECIEKEVVQPYSIVGEKNEEYIARVKFTVVVKDKPILICGKAGDSELEKLK